MLNVALPKGRLGDKVYDLLAGWATAARRTTTTPASWWWKTGGRHPLLPGQAQRRGHLRGARRGGHRHRGQGHPGRVRRRRL